MADLPVNLLAAIGDVTVSWGYVQNLMDVAIWGMLGLTVKDGNSRTAPFSYRRRMELLRRTGRHFFQDRQELLAEFNSLVATIDDQYRKRNEVEHSTWQYLGGMSVRVRMLADASIEPQFKTAKDVDAVAQDIIRLVMSLNQFTEAYIPPPKSPAARNSTP